MRHRENLVFHIMRIQPGVSFAAFSSVNVDNFIDAVRQLPNKSSAADPMPTSVLMQVGHLVASYVTELFNRSLVAGHFPSGYKEAFITPIVKKAGVGMSVHINQSRICLSHQSFLSASFFAN